ncbi:alpha-keto acid decarboxylase family protein [Spirosoma fluviale]|uniref:Indolepyruvate decarboxylase n=1 Tax=Spirosoma fluviale TaxID=1597977 RepID=A0A286GPJ4_9BACT|nr:thiamine pyrophosphate-binding protein [Spirosoma fluviale]SOD97465.1 indolepyruvate decarboxylase [Spirosoma fluviale]
MSTTTTFCVGTYLTTRLEELGVGHLFSVPGDYTSDLLEIVDTKSTIQRIGNCNELNAGYAADGYARANGLGAVAVTTGVGSFSVLNAIGGAYVEMIPVVTIIGTLSNVKRLNAINAGELFHHNTGPGDENRLVFQGVTVAYEQISDPLQAPNQIDHALTMCISQKRPVVIEILEDCYKLPCPAPQGTLSPTPLFTPLEQLKVLAPTNTYAKGIVTAVHDAAQEICTLLTDKKVKPVFWIGHELGRYDLQELFNQLLAKTGVPFVSSLLGKAVLAEDTPGYLGIYNGIFSQTQLADYDCIIALGVWNTDLNVFGEKLKAPLGTGNPAAVLATRNVVKIGTTLYSQVSLENLLTEVLAQLKPQSSTSDVYSTAVLPACEQEADQPITYDTFFAGLNGYLTPQNLVVADIGLSTFGGSSFLTINRQNGFLAQAIWASIGWSVPAGLGASFTPGVRPIVIVGDGAFKLTCQEISTMVACGCNTVVFVLNNGVYAVEQILLNAEPFQKDSTAKFEAANVLQAWDYISLLKGFSNNDPQAMSAAVNTIGELNEVLAQISMHSGAVWLVSINLNERDFPASWQPFVTPKD